MKKCIDFIRYWGMDTITNKKFRKLPLEIKVLYYYRILHDLEIQDISKNLLDTNIIQKDLKI